MCGMSDYNTRTERIYDIVAGNFAILYIIFQVDAVKAGKPDLAVHHLDVPGRIDHYRRRRYVIAAVEGLMPVYAAGEVHFVYDAALNGCETAGTGGYRPGAVAQCICTCQLIQLIVGMGKCQPVEGYVSDTSFIRPLDRVQPVSHRDSSYVENRLELWNDHLGVIYILTFQRDIIKSTLGLVEIKISSFVKKLESVTYYLIVAWIVLSVIAQRL